MGWQAEVIANIFFSICKAWKIYCEDNGAVPGSLSPSYHHFRKLGAVIGVKLEPEGAAGCIGDFLRLRVETVLAVIRVRAMPAPWAVAHSPSGCVMHW